MDMGKLALDLRASGPARGKGMPRRALRRLGPDLRGKTDERRARLDAQVRSCFLIMVVDMVVDMVDMVVVDDCC